MISTLVIVICFYELELISYSHHSNFYVCGYFGWLGNLEVCPSNPGAIHHFLFFTCFNLYFAARPVIYQKILCSDFLKQVSMFHGFQFLL